MRRPSRGRIGLLLTIALLGAAVALSLATALGDSARSKPVAVRVWISDAGVVYVTAAHLGADGWEHLGARKVTLERHSAARFSHYRIGDVLYDVPLPLAATPVPTKLCRTGPWAGAPIPADVDCPTPTPEPSPEPTPEPTPTWEPAGEPPYDRRKAELIRGPYEEARIVPQVGCSVSDPWVGNGPLYDGKRVATVRGAVYVIHNWGGAAPANEWGAYTVTATLTLRGPDGLETTYTETRSLGDAWLTRYWSRDGHRGFVDVTRPYLLSFPWDGDVAWDAGARTAWIAVVGHTTTSDDLHCTIEATYDAPHEPTPIPSR